MGISSVSCRWDRPYEMVVANVREDRVWDRKTQTWRRCLRLQKDGPNPDRNAVLVYLRTFLFACCLILAFNTFSFTLTLTRTLSHTHTHSHPHIHTHIHTHTRAHEHTYAHTHTQTHTNTSIHTFPHAPSHSHAHMGQRWAGNGFDAHNRRAGSVVAYCKRTLNALPP
jgi:hypothetical protein